MTRWQVRIEGDALDLQFLARIFTSMPRQVIQDQVAGYLYESDAFAACTASQEVEKVAEEELAVLSGILKIECDARKRLTRGAVYRLRPDGGKDVFVSLQESVHARAVAGVVAVVITDAAGNVIAQPPPPPPRAAQLLQLATGDIAVSKALRLLSAPDSSSWVGLYRLYEVIEQDVGGEHRLKKLSWGSATDLKRFKASANSVAVGGDQSRHGKEQTAPPKNPMTLAEAGAYCSYLAQAWLASKGV